MFQYNHVARYCIGMASFSCITKISKLFINLIFRYLMAMSFCFYGWVEGTHRDTCKRFCSVGMCSIQLSLQIYCCVARRVLTGFPVWHRYWDKHLQVDISVRLHQFLITAVYLYPDSINGNVVFLSFYSFARSSVFFTSHNREHPSCSRIA